MFAFTASSANTSRTGMPCGTPSFRALTVSIPDIALLAVSVFVSLLAVVILAGVALIPAAALMITLLVLLPVVIPAYSQSPHERHGETATSAKA